MNDNTYTLQPAIPFDYYDTPWQGYGPDWDVDADEIVYVNTVPNKDSLGEAYKWLSKTAWMVRRIEAERFGIPLMAVRWRRCLLLAALINDRRRRMNSWLVAGIKQCAWRGHSSLLWS